MQPVILAIEDNPDIQSLLTDVLVPKFQVIHALDGASGYHQFKQNDVDLVILDLMLPGVSGESVLHQIRLAADTPIIVLTAIQEKQKIGDLLNAGANDYLTKPFDIEELVARINVQLRSHSLSNQASKEQLVFGELTLNSETHAVTVAGQPLSLPKKEFQLLQLLMTHPHQVFEKAQLYERVWQEPYENAESTLNVHLSNLRLKLNHLATKSYIRSIWGVGIRLV